MARPSKLTPALADQLETICDDQWSIKDACGTLGIDESTWRRWEASTAEDDLHVRFRTLATRVRASAGSKIDDLAWGTLRKVLEDPEVRASDLVAAASAILRLRTAHKVEVSGANGGAITLQSLHAKAVE